MTSLFDSAVPVDADGLALLEVRLPVLGGNTFLVAGGRQPEQYQQ